jgi:hypothetical protein
MTVRTSHPRTPFEVIEPEITSAPLDKARVEDRQIGTSYTVRSAETLDDKHGRAVRSNDTLDDQIDSAFTRLRVSTINGFGRDCD